MLFNQPGPFFRGDQGLAGDRHLRWRLILREVRCLRLRDGRGRWDVGCLVLLRRLSNGHAELLRSRLRDLHRLKSRLTVNELNNLPRGQPAKDISSWRKGCAQIGSQEYRQRNAKEVHRTSSILVAKQAEANSQKLLLQKTICDGHRDRTKGQNKRAHLVSVVVQTAGSARFALWAENVWNGAHFPFLDRLSRCHLVGAAAVAPVPLPGASPTPAAHSLHNTQKVSSNRLGTA